MNISFKLGERKDTDIVRIFFQKRNLNYKGYNLWLPKAIEEYRYEIKHAMLGFYEGRLVSAIMFQDCKHINGFTELKSVRTIKKLQRRLFSSFELRQIETISRQEGKLGVICDTRSYRLDVLFMLKTNGYKEIARDDLYKEGYEDIVLAKSLLTNS